MNLSQYNYQLPSELIAQHPASPRDHSRLFVYNTQTNQISFDWFFNLDKYLTKNHFLVMNKTKVVPSRITLKKSTGGKIICLFLVNEDLNDQLLIRFMPDRKINVNNSLFFDHQLIGNVIFQDNKYFTLRLAISRLELIKILENNGSMPVPLYIKHPPKKDKLKTDYQTIFADDKIKRLGSCAAPTASLHFTNRVFTSLQSKEINKYYITLHVGLGTFAPVTSKNIQQKKLHQEYFEVDNQILKEINHQKTSGKQLVAVGTTTVRTLEAYNQSTIIQTSLTTGSIDLFIFPPFNFQMVDAMMTNFHLPQTSLVMLVEAFLQYKQAKKTLVKLYKIAIDNHFRFYSFGDVMLIL